MSEGRIGFIGGGMMAEALIGGIIDAGIHSPGQILASDISEERRRKLSDTYGVRTTSDNLEAFAAGETVVLAVKPQHFREALTGLEKASQTPLVISIMAGVPTEAIEAALPPKTPVVRVMPNIPCLVKEAASALARGRWAGDPHEARAKEILSAVGRAVVVDESLMDAVTGLSGSGPAYVFAVIESLADGAVAEGLPRRTALELAAQTVVGAGKMVLQSGEHPAVLRDRVTSPAGTTAEGLAALERNGLRNALVEAVRAAAKRSKELGKGTA